VERTVDTDRGESPLSRRNPPLVGLSLVFALGAFVFLLLAPVVAGASVGLLSWPSAIAMVAAAANRQV